MVVPMGIRRSVRHRWALAQRLEFWSDRSGGPTACWPWTGSKTTGGYGHLRYKGKLRDAHVWAWEDANGQSVPAGMEVAHSCDNPSCVNPLHLDAKLHIDNHWDMAMRGRGTALFTPQQVRLIRRDRRSGDVIAAEYKTTKSTINKIKRRETYQHVH